MVSCTEYCRGMIILADFKDKGGQFNFIQGRPLVIISEPDFIHNTVTVVTCGTQHWPGIKASLWSYPDNAFIGGNKESFIFPYSIHTIRVADITKVYSILNRITLNAVVEAASYHMGISDKIPPYYALPEVQYSTVNKAQEYCDKYNIAFPQTPAEYNRSFHAKEYTPPTPPKVLENSHRGCGYTKSFSNDGKLYWMGNEFIPSLWAEDIKPLHAKKGKYTIEDLNKVLNARDYQLIICKMVDRKHITDKLAVHGNRIGGIINAIEKHVLNRAKKLISRLKANKHITDLNLFDRICIMYSQEFLRYSPNYQARFAIPESLGARSYYLKIMNKCSIDFTDTTVWDPKSF